MGQDIKLTASDGHTYDAYRADPEGDVKGGLVLIQEIFGVNKHIREVADEWAGAGYAVIAPALFDRAESGVVLGYGEEDRQKGMETRGKVEWDDTVKDSVACADALGDAGKVGIIGYCFGGTVAWLGACSGSFAAASCYYGGGIGNFLDKDATCPVMMNFGEADQGIPMETVDKIKAAKPDAIVHTYEGAGHGFICDERPSFNQAATDLARTRSREFFGQHL